ncbi:GumC family protein [Flagellimonas allohymeniacidonis]|uniref:non-specific protein-tyrosine kinase n=1 Tax=Flagellimonas allohymeniacidonis TaxID=2517819 RepID=A0A4V2HSP5_9FLAO|nr:tyrosine-protein kinase family protein [Allomuricauda hymeniacidonis]TAI48590.1 polysaccharide biosynthesis tyrosine autokinase [Allomuricauda hymeniacidonis]
MNKSEIDLKGLLTVYTKHWKWFAACTIVALGLAFLNLRYAIPQYNASAKILILQEKTATSELSVLQDLNVLPGGKTEIKDEIQILRARSNFMQVIRDLRLNVRYFVMGNVKDTELYGDANYPFSIDFLAADSIINKSEHEFYVDLNSDTSVMYSEFENGPFKNYDFGTNISTKIGDIVLTPYWDRMNRFQNKRLKVVVNPIPSVVQRYRSKIKISPADELSNIVNISLTDAIQKRAMDLIDNLIATYNKNGVEDKKAVADRTSRFINDRIADIYNNLSSVDESAETFKSSRGIADLGSQSSVNFTQSAAGERDLQDASIQLNIANSMKDLISNQSDYEIIPTNVGLSDQGISTSAQRYNELVAQRNRLLESSNEKNPVIVKLDQQLESLRRGMQSSLNNVTNNLDLRVNSLSKQLSQINSRIYAAPSNERALRDISRKQQTTESLYLYLLQKREESQITFASATPKSKVVDAAYAENPFPVSPKPKIIYLAALMVGLMIPFGVIYTSILLDDKIHNKIDLEKMVQGIPVLAEIPKLGRKEEKLVKNADRSVLAESLRILRTNLDYTLRSKKNSKRGSIIFVTSSVPGEGKTLVSSNLSMIFADTNKKVLLIGADIRNPKLYTFFSNSNEIDQLGKPKHRATVGLTEYLLGSAKSVRDIVNTTLVHSNTIDVIYSGKIPPNPTELLMSSRMKDLLDEVSELYDYIVVDTAPLMVVTDTLLINQYADKLLYITKAGVTQRKVLDFPLKLHKEGKLKGLAFVVNNVKGSNLGYGGRYGYGYGKTVKKWWNFAS